MGAIKRLIIACFFCFLASELLFASGLDKEQLQRVEPINRSGLSDDDSDGVIDARDQCPDTKKQLSVNSNGCPEKVIETVKKKVFIPFYPDNPETTTLKISQIQKLAIAARQYPSAAIILTGHSEEMGVKQKNMSVGLSRAQSVKDTLIKLFKVNDRRIKVRSLGAMRPLESVATALNKKKNRRVIGVVKVTIEGQQKRWNVFK